jgi:hypothetical protein
VFQAFHRYPLNGCHCNQNKEDKLNIIPTFFHFEEVWVFLIYLDWGDVRNKYLLLHIFKSLGLFY